MVQSGLRRRRPRWRAPLLTVLVVMLLALLSMLQLAQAWRPPG